jgi:hypothetical protein
MDFRDHPSILRLTREAKRHAPLLVFGALAFLILASTAVALAVSRTAPDHGAGQVAAASPTDRAEATPSISPTPSPSVTLEPATPAPAATPHAGRPSADPTSEPIDGGIGIDTDPVADGEEYHDEEPIDVEDPDYMLAPEIDLTFNGMGMDAGFYIRSGEAVEAVLQFPTRDLDESACSLTQSYEPDDPSGMPWTVSLEPVPVQTVSMADGWHTFVAECPSSVGDLTARVRAIAMDRKPEACRDFEFVRDEISVSSYKELAAGVVGTWKGCVTTPWTPMYEVTVTFRDDGTYSASTTEVLDGSELVAMYYGTDDDFPAKLYAINDLQDSRLGVGQIDVVFGPEPGVRDELRNMRLMGDKLEFELFHLDRYGPLTFQLERQ